MIRGHTVAGPWMLLASVDPKLVAKITPDLLGFQPSNIAASPTLLPGAGEEPHGHGSLFALHFFRVSLISVSKTC
jgi:hypothetical protein